MEGFSLVDIYSTKGIEYLIAAVFFFGFLALQRNIFGQIPRRVFFHIYNQQVIWAWGAAHNPKVDSSK